MKRSLRDRIALGSLTACVLAGCSGGPTDGVAVLRSASANAIEREATTTTLTETPLAADALADSIGVNTHVSTYFALPDYATIVARAKALGARHVRDGILDADPAYDTALTQLLAASNAKLDGITDCAGIQYYSGSPTSPADIQAFDAAIGNRLEAVEGPNEVDARNDANWVTDTSACLPALRSAEPALPFVAPSLANPYADAQKLGNLATDVTDGNVHRYFSGHNPGTAGWGGWSTCGKYGALDWAICLARINAGSNPVEVTESGYNSQSEVDEITQAKYLTRLFLVDLAAGVPRTYVYDLRDYVGGDGFGGDGLIRTDESTKPAFDAVANEIAFFSDPGAALPKSSLTYSIASSGISHVLFQKRDGTYVLALWNETLSYDTSAKKPIAVPAANVTVSLGRLPLAPAAQIFADTGALQVAPVSTTTTTMSVAVDDHVTLLTFR